MNTLFVIAPNSVHMMGCGVMVAAVEPLVSEGYGLGLLALLGFVILNGFFAASEFALIKVRLSQLEELAEEGNRTAGFVQRMAMHLDQYLAAAQLGMTICSLVLGWLATPVLAQLLDPVLAATGLVPGAAADILSIVLALLILVILHAVMGALVPKALAARKPVGTALVIARPLAGFHYLLRPAVWFLSRSTDFLLRQVFRFNPADNSETAHSEEELRQIVTESESSEEVSPIGRELLINALDMSRRVTRDIMTPRGQVVSLDIEDTFEDNLALALESRHTRFPLCRDHLDNTLGLVHIKDLLAALHAGRRDLIEIKRELHPVSEMMPLETLLKFFLGRRAHLALVVDEFGGTVGIVTLDNVLAELVGDIRDEFDLDQPEFVRLSDEEFVVAGTLGLYELQEYADLEVVSSEVSTVGGYVVHQLGHLPRVGESVEIEEYTATVTKTDGRCVGQVHFRRLPRTTPTGNHDASAEHEQLSE